MTSTTTILDIDIIPMCVVIYTIDKDGNYIFKAINKKLEDTESVLRKNLIGEKLEDKFPGIRAMGLIDLFDRVYSTGKQENLNLGLYEDNRIYGWKKNSVIKLDDNSLLVIYEDITDEHPYVEEFEKILQRKTEELKASVSLLEDSNKKLEKLTDTLQEEVQKGIEKHELQFKQILAQSRLAQMGEMISMIAHQWRQPLGAISTTTANLKMKLELGSFDFSSSKDIKKTSKYFIKKFDDIEIFVQSLTTTIDDFRNFYKPNKKTTKASIRNPFEHALHIMNESLKTKNIELVKRYKSQNIIEFYESEITQVILNILKNAQDNFLEKNIKEPKIYLSCKDTSRGVIINICDNGGGIPLEIIDKIFDPYFSTKDDKNGTGLGLYMSKMIIEEHHFGSLIATNKDDGVCFTMYLKNTLKKSKQSVIKV